MLKLNEQDFTIGRSRFFDQHPVGSAEPTAKVFVRIELQGLAEPLFAQLDTGSAWSILDPEIAEVVAGIGELEDLEEKARLSTRLGVLEGRFVRTQVTLIADEGSSLCLEGTFFVPSSDWRLGRVFLGYSGLLDSIRIALDSPANQFYFGESEGRSSG